MRIAYLPGLVYDPNMFGKQGQRHEQPCQTNLETAMRALNSQASTSDSALKFNLYIREGYSLQRAHQYTKFTYIRKKGHFLIKGLKAFISYFTAGDDL